MVIEGQRPQAIKRGFSEVSNSMADRLLRSTGLQEVDGWQVDKAREELPGSIYTLAVMQVVVILSVLPELSLLFL